MILHTSPRQWKPVKYRTRSLLELHTDLIRLEWRHQRVTPSISHKKLDSITTSIYSRTRSKSNHNPQMWVLFIIIKIACSLTYLPGIFDKKKRNHTVRAKSLGTCFWSNETAKTWPMRSSHYLVDVLWCFSKALRLTCEQGRCAPWNSVAQRIKKQIKWQLLVYALEKSAVNKWPNADVILQREHFTFIRC